MRPDDCAGEVQRPHVHAFFDDGAADLSSRDRRPREDDRVLDGRIHQADAFQNLDALLERRIVEFRVGVNGGALDEEQVDGVEVALRRSDVNYVSVDMLSVEQSHGFVHYVGYRRR